MEDFQEKYIQDAQELIENLEGSLLKLEEKDYDAETIEEVFRFMHTLKGSAGMFGFHFIEELTHHLENVYDSVREGQITIDEELTELTLNAVDLIKTILDNQGQINSERQAEFDALLQKSKDLDQSVSHADTETGEQAEAASAPSSKKQTFFLISLTPQPYIFERGIRPKNVFQELEGLMDFKAVAFTDKIPDLESLQPEQLHISWEIFATAAIAQEEVEDIFLFFEEDEFSIKTYDTEQLSTELLESDSRAFAEKRISIEDLNFQEQNESSGAKDKAPAEKGAPSQQNQVATEQTVRVSAEKLDDLVNLVSEFVTLNSRLSLISDRLGEDDLKKSLSELFKLSKRFRENALDLRLMPIEVLVVKFKRLVRDLSKKMNKQVEFTAEGTDTKLDKSIIERIESPLMHIIRNAIDHGVENPEERKAMNKPEKGVIRMVAFYSGASVFVQIRDDGKGIDKDYIKRRGIEKGMINPNEPLSDDEIYGMIFKPGFSTAQSLTEISGRGVGMDVVQKSITELRGEINIESEKNLGTSVTLKLPLTLSIIDALLVTVSSWNLLVPISSVETVQAIKTSELQNNERMQVEYNEQLIPLINLRKFMEIPGQAPEKQNVIILNHEGKSYGMLVDKIKTEHQAVIKPLGHLHRKQEYLAGASVLGDGSLALILNIKSLIREKSESIHIS